MKTIKLIALTSALCISTSCAFAADVVRLDARCTDSTLQYSVQKAAIDAIQSDSKYKLAAGGVPHVAVVRLIAVPIKTESQATPTAVAIALSAARKTGNGWENVAFSNTLIQYEDISRFVRDSVLEALGEK